MDKVRSLSFDFLPLALRPPYLHFSLVGIVIILFGLWIFSNRFKFFYHHWKRKRNPPAPFDPRLLKYYQNAVLFWLVFILLGAGMLAVSFYLTRYQFLAQRVEPAGQATVRRHAVHYVDQRGRQMTATARGSLIAAAGIFIKFPGWMSVFGLQNYHQLITFRGNQESQFHYGKKPEADWIASYADPVYVFLYRYNEWVPFATTDYIESVYFPPGKHRILVTNKGYIIQ